MAARTYSNQMISSSDWDDLVAALALPLTDTGNNKCRFNSDTSKWEFYIGGTLVATIDSSGNLNIKGEIKVLQTL